MNEKNKTIDPLPDSFETEVDAGAFWDTHSTMGYLEYLEPVNDTIEIRDRVFEVALASDVYERLTRQAGLTHESVPQLVDRILRTSLAN